jgi:hypothetical protein
MVAPIEKLQLEALKLNTGVVLVVELVDKLLNAPVDAVVAPMDVPLIVPPVIATVFAFWVDIVPSPVIEVFGIVADAVIAEVPLPYT